jgi:hypothetical protein
VASPNLTQMDTPLRAKAGSRADAVQPSTVVDDDSFEFGEWEV